jgi:uncharacterized protein (TIGR00730 family)
MDKKKHPRPDHITEFMSEHLPRLEKHPHRPYVEQIIRTALRISEQDDMDLLDLKIMNSALRELRYAFQVFKPYRATKKVSLFGSARTPSSSPYYQSAAKFSSLIAKEGWMIITGAASGIMQAGNEGAGSKKSFGVNILLPFEQSANRVITGDPKLMNFKYFFTRKLMFMRESGAVVLYPGGFGTHDEGFEALTLLQTGKSAPCPIVLVDLPGKNYWKDWDKFIHKHLEQTKLISAPDRRLYKIVTSPQAAVRELQLFYSNYHSLRYFPEETVIRLKKKPTKKLIKLINKKFESLHIGLGFEIIKPRKEELLEPAIKNLYRISFRFRRNELGLLRVLIDTLNRQG